MPSDRFNFAIYELHNNFIHGYDINSDHNIKGHYLCMYLFKIYNSEDEEDENNGDSSIIEYSNIADIINLCKNYYDNQLNINWRVHEFIRNYDAIISHANYIKPEIVEVFYLSGGESVAILKTFWIKIIQRAWKRVYLKRCIVISKRKEIKSLHYREYNGKWPNSCFYLPSIKSLLNTKKWS